MKLCFFDDNRLGVVEGDSVPGPSIVTSAVDVSTSLPVFERLSVTPDSRVRVSGM